MNEDKQGLFMDRVLFLHGVALCRAGKASVVKLSIAEWNSECDKMCCISYMGEMARLHDDDGNLLFDDGTVASIRQRALEGYLC